MLDPPDIAHGEAYLHAGETMSETVPVVEIFKSIQGEGPMAGYPCAFVRTAGCNLNCSYCDTRFACEAEGRAMSLGEIVDEVEKLGCSNVCVTGGEPLIHKYVTLLCGELIAKRPCTVILETNGTQDIGCISSRVMTVMDIKCPGSGECGKTLWKNLKELSGGDVVKFVIGDREDFEWAARCVEERRSLWMTPVYFAPVWDKLAGSELAEWILDAGLTVRLQLQLQKILWPDKSRGV